jgi:hypothetical protein
VGRRSPAATTSDVASARDEGRLCRARKGIVG